MIEQWGQGDDVTISFKNDACNLAAQGLVCNPSGRNQ
jgi:hypothetical protein